MKIMTRDESFWWIRGVAWCDSWEKVGTIALGVRSPAKSDELIVG